MKVFKWVLIGTLAVAFICCLSFIGWGWWVSAGPNPALHKLVMPGHYRVSLNPGTYQGWIYTRWQSQHIQTQNDPHALSVKITDPKQGRTVPQQPLNLYGANEGGQIGEVTTWFKITTSGEYEFSADRTERFVFVVVPIEQVCVGLGSDWGYQGQFGDFNFDQPSAK